ncbi:MAG: hypothetical protein ABIJ96_14130 [Elusimicrobiota bacterium]
MLAARIGWILVALAVIGGFAFGRYRRYRIITPISVVPSRRGLSTAVQLSTAAALQLPSDVRVADSVPRGLE